MAKARVMGRFPKRPIPGVGGPRPRDPPPTSAFPSCNPPPPSSTRAGSLRGGGARRGSIPEPRGDPGSMKPALHLGATFRVAVVLAGAAWLAAHLSPRSCASLATRATRKPVAAKHQPFIGHDPGTLVEGSGWERRWIVGWGDPFRQLRRVTPDECQRVCHRSVSERIAMPRPPDSRGIGR